MIQALGLFLTPTSLYMQYHSCESLKLPTPPSYYLNSYVTYSWQFKGLRKFSINLKHYHTKFNFPYCHLQNSIGQWHVQSKDKKYGTCESNLFLDIQTLKNFAAEKLFGEFVVLRFDSILLLEPLDIHNASSNRALSTIRYLYNAGAKVLLISSWGSSADPMLLSVETVAGYISLLLQVKVVPANDVSGWMEFKSEKFHKADILLFGNLTNFREELANCPVFSEKLASGANIFINDAFFLSHKILASTVGATRFCYVCLAGFHFEEQLLQLKKIREIGMQPYLAIIGGGNFLEKADALHLLASICDGLIFVGMLAFQVMNALGITVPSCLLEHDAFVEASDLTEFVNSREISIYFPTDLWCVNDDNPQLFQVFPSERILPGWTPIDLGPTTLKEIYNVLLKCKKVLWIGPVKFGSSEKNALGASELALMLERIGKGGCDITVIGNAACQSVLEAKCSPSVYKMFKNASVVWKFLNGKMLPGVAALDRAYPYEIDWCKMYEDPAQPLFVDIGSGNGLFAFKMSEKWKSLNFLGLEINNTMQLVRHCLDGIIERNRKNVYFISTNATSTFGSIVSTYPGELILVSIQCPNPDFNREGHRWRMVQRALVEAIIDLLPADAKIFLQSDMECVTIRMKEQFMKYGKGRLVDDDEDTIWLPENPCGVLSDWEQHVIDRGDLMYRVMLRKVGP